MIEATLGIMTFFEWAFALASLSKDPDFTKFLPHSAETRIMSKDLRAQQFKFSWLVGLLLLQNKIGQVRSQERLYRSFGSSQRHVHPGPRISCFLLGYFFAVTNTFINRRTLGRTGSTLAVEVFFVTTAGSMFANQ